MISILIFTIRPKNNTPVCKNTKTYTKLNQVITFKMACDDEFTPEEIEELMEEFEDEDYDEDYDEGYYEVDDQGRDEHDDDDHDESPQFSDDVWDYCDDDYVRYASGHHRFIHPVHRTPSQTLNPSQMEARWQLIVERHQFLASHVGTLPDGYNEMLDGDYEPPMDAINARVDKIERAFMAKIQPGVFEDDGMGNAEMVMIIPKKSRTPK